MSTDRTTTRRPYQLKVDTIVTVCPDERSTQFGEAGRWTLTERPVQFDAWVRVDFYDEEDRRDGVWFLPFQQDVTVELSRGELLVESARLAGSFVDLDLPPMLSWNASRDGLVGSLGSSFAGTPDEIRRDMEAWADHLGADVTSGESDDKYMRLEVTAVHMGVPVEVRATYYTPKPAEPEKAETGVEVANDHEPADEKYAVFGDNSGDQLSEGMTRELARRWAAQHRRDYPNVPVTVRVVGPADAKAEVAE